MARVTIEDCLKLVDNRFKLVLIASHRARMIMYGGKPLLEPQAEKPCVVALREISAGLVDEEILKQPTKASPLDDEYPSFLTDDQDAPSENFPESGAEVAPLSGSSEEPQELDEGEPPATADN